MDYNAITRKEALGEIERLRSEIGKLKEQLRLARATIADAAESRQVLEAIMESVPEGITITGGPPDFPIRMVSRYGAQIAGLSPEWGLKPLPAGQYVETWGFYMPGGATRPGLDEMPLYRATRLGEEVVDKEFLYKRPDGRELSILISASPMRDQKGRIVGGISRWHNITERKQIEEALKKVRDQLEQRVVERTGQLEQQTRLVENERDRLRTLLDSMSDGVWLTDAEGNVLLANRVAREQAVEVGLDPDTRHGTEMLSRIEVFALDGTSLGFETIARVIEGHPLRLFEIGVRNKEGGETFYRRLSVDRIAGMEQGIQGVVVVVQDITPQKRAEEEKGHLEEQLRQAQKMEAVGTLAGGIAHDFNNMLAVILGNAELALDDLSDREGPSGNIEQIVKAAKRARDLTKQILAFSRKAERGRNPIRLKPLLAETYELLRGTLPSTIRMDLDVRTEKDAVIADPSQMQQVIINLATNGAYAMRKKGGVLTLGLTEGEFKRSDRVIEDRLHPGSYVRLSVQDTGTGMTEKVSKRIFEPFFTTKAPGEGTGMGLAVVYGIVKNHGGDITVESEAGRGSTFSIYLPSATHQAGVPREEPKETPGGTERILLVDDEPAVLQTATRTLERLGYKVTSAESGTEAWRMFQKEPGGFDLVITDQVMPDLTGVALARKILKVRREMPVVLFTGYSETVTEEDAKAAGIRDFVMKPITKREAAQTIRRVLDVRDKD